MLKMQEIALYTELCFQISQQIMSRTPPQKKNQSCDPSPAKKEKSCIALLVLF